MLHELVSFIGSYLTILFILFGLIFVGVAALIMRDIVFLTHSLIISWINQRILSSSRRKMFKHIKYYWKDGHLTIKDLQKMDPKSEVRIND